MSRTLRYARNSIAAAILAAAAFAFREMVLVHLPGVFSAPEEDMDFAWFVPVFSAWILWRERAAIRAAAGRPSAWGAVASIPFLALAFIGVRGVQVRFELAAFIGLAITLTWALFGRACAKRIAFPALCLLFCMPVASYLSIFTVHLRLFVSAVSSGLLNAAGAEVFRQGNMIAIPGVLDSQGGAFVIDIANPCSGLRSIFALMAISIGYGYFTQPTWPRRAALFALSVPIAVVANIVRIVSICVVAKCCSSTFAIGFYHDFSGFIVFAVAIFALLVAGGLLEKLPPPAAKARPADGTDAAAEPAPATVRRDAAALAAAAALAVPALLATAFAPAPVLTEPKPFAFPEVSGFTRTAREPSVAETNLLAGAEISKCEYRSAKGFWFDVTRVTSGPNKNSLHRPELCLPSQGFDMGERGVISAGGVEWRTIRLDAKGDRPGANYAYTFFNQSGCRTSSHETRIMRDVWDRSVRGVIDRWTMVTVFVPSADPRALELVLQSLGRIFE